MCKLPLNQRNVKLRFVPAPRDEKIRMDEEIIFAVVPNRFTAFSCSCSTDQ